MLMFYTFYYLQLIHNLILFPFVKHGLINMIYNYIILKVIFRFIQLELINMAEVLYYILIVNTKLIKLIIYHIVTHL